MKVSIFGLCFFLMIMQGCSTQQNANTTTANTANAKQEIIDLSKIKWQWMADKNIDKLTPLFHDKAKFVHMSGTSKKAEELDIIKTGSIWYKKTDVHDVAAEIVGDVAIVWSRITLTAVVRG